MGSPLSDSLVSIMLGVSMPSPVCHGPPASLFLESPFDALRCLKSQEEELYLRCHVPTSQSDANNLPRCMYTYAYYRTTCALSEKIGTENVFKSRLKTGYILLSIRGRIKTEQKRMKNFRSMLFFISFRTAVLEIDYLIKIY